MHDFPAQQPALDLDDHLARALVDRAARFDDGAAVALAWLAVLVAATCSTLTPATTAHVCSLAAHREDGHGDPDGGSSQVDQ